MTLRAIVAALVCLLAAPAGAEDGFPFDVGGPFELTDQNGQTRSEADPDGRAQLLFFGYANCQQICSAALPGMADAARLLAAAGHAVTPVMITVDPRHDTPDEMRSSLARHHADFVGLTGGPDALGRAYRAFGVDIEELFVDPDYGPVYAHGSYLYLLDADGRVLSVMPPVLTPGRMAEIARTYLDGAD